MKAEEVIFNKIIDAIQDIGDIGATIEEISKAVPLERHTLSKYMNHLRADGRVSYKQIGRAKVWFVSKAPLQHIFRLSEEEKTYTEKIFSRILEDMPEGVLILDFDYNILFMNRYLTALYGDCIGQKYYLAFFGTARQEQSQIAEVIEGKAEEVESQEEDKEGRILDVKAKRVINPDGSFSIIAIIRDVTEKVMYERRIKNLSELHRLLGESVNRSYTIDQLCSTILKNLRDIIGFDMGDILIYDPVNDILSSYALIGYSREAETSEAEEWKRRIASEAIHHKEVFFFDSTEKGTDENELTLTASNIADKYNLQEAYAIPLKTKGMIHGALLIFTKKGKILSKEDRGLLEGVSEAIAGGIAKIKAEEELILKANAFEISRNPVLMADMEGKLTYVNPAFLRTWGYDKEGEVLGRPYGGFWKVETEDVVTAVREKGSWEGVLIALRKNGSEFNARISASLIIGKKGPLQLVALAEPEKENEN
ncbi:MAG: PAS domain-containing protein [Halobacteriota archaeon]